MARKRTNLKDRNRHTIIGPLEADHRRHRYNPAQDGVHLFERHEYHDMGDRHEEIEIGFVACEMGNDIHKAVSLVVGLANERFNGAGPYYAIGENPLKALNAFAVLRGWSRIESVESLTEPDESRYDWALAFMADGDGHKCAGINVPGGCILTWWK